MHLVDAHRLPLPFGGPLSFHPRFIRPLVLVERPDPRGSLDSVFAVKGKRIALHVQMSVMPQQLKFVVGVLSDAGEKKLPDSDRDQFPHWVNTPIPAIPFPNNRNTPRVRRPYAKNSAADALMLLHVCAEHLPELPMISLRIEMLIQFSEQYAKCVRIFILPNMAVVCRETQPVAAKRPDL